MIQLGSGAFIKAICPNPSHFHHKLYMACSGDADELDSNQSDVGDDSGDEDWLLDEEGDDPNTPAEEIDEDVEYDPNDLLGKILALVTQVSIEHHYPLR